VDFFVKYAIEYFGTGGRICVEFGEILRELLEEREITQKRLAQELNMAVSTLGNYIRDNREPDYKTLKKIADYFHVSTDYLLNHSTRKNSDHQEEHLLEIYHTLSPEYQKLLLEQGKILLKYGSKSNGQMEQ